MFTCNNHFLDSNILLGKILPSNNFKIFETYFKQDFNRNISNRIEKESNRVISNSRRVSLKLLHYFKENILDKSSNPLKSDNTLVKIRNEFLNSYIGISFPEGVKKDRFTSMIKNLFEEFYDGFQEDLITQSTYNIDNFIKETINTFRYFSKDLNQIILTK
ncbi:hypothetical protein [Methanobrevibacter filiformis]|uniref:Uncharacterized protein n=1 Tax=Methanobrevibacter filiformis TaxID=55758 RepID=A0A166CVV9_9EURY|nr:hypothetical protein [Methanobrevibacter filiformis]KZX17177.1 hypothetical protein MBFIL_03150 [Methanobrevibacter filiformis]